MRGRIQEHGASYYYEGSSSTERADGMTGRRGKYIVWALIFEVTDHRSEYCSFNKFTEFTRW